MYKKMMMSLMLSASSVVFAGDANWTGAYVGGSLGYADGDSHAKISSLGGNWASESQALRNAVLSGSKNKQGDSDWTAGVQAGYDWQLANHIVLGIGADLQKLDMQEKQTRTVSSLAIYQMMDSFDVDSSFSIRPRLGYAMDHVLLYVTAGVAWTRVEFKSSILSSGNYRKAGSEKETLTSAVFGAGVEYQLADHWTVKAEYLKTDSASASYSSKYQAGSNPVFSPPAANYTEKYRHRFDDQALNVSVNYRF